MSIDLAIKEINKRFKNKDEEEEGEKVRFGSDVLNPKPNHTGSFDLDIKLVCPIPEGAIVELFGLEGSGKTTIALECLGAAQKRGKRVAYLNSEGTINRSLLSSIRTLNLSELLIIPPADGETCLNAVLDFAKLVERGVVVVDSVDSLVPKAILSGEVGEATMGLHARMISAACRKFSQIVNKTKSTIIFINQIRDKLTPYGQPYTTSGGRGLPFYASQRIELKQVAKADKIMNKDAKRIGHRARYHIVKNKLAPSDVEGSVTIMYGKGISRETELANLLGELGLVETGGKGQSLLKLKDPKTEEMMPAMGREAVAKLFESDPNLFTYYENILMSNFF